MLEVKKIKKLYRNYSINDELFEKLRKRLTFSYNVKSLSYKDFYDLTTDVTKWKKLTECYISFSQTTNEIYFLLPGYIINGAVDFSDQKLLKTFISSYYYILRFCKTDELTSNKINNDINGHDAFTHFIRLLKLHNYNDTTIDEVIAKEGIQEEEKPLHEGLFYELPFLIENQNRVVKIDHCEYYDLNKAYASCLMKFFPKAAEAIKEGYNTDDPAKKALWKKTINFAVGFFQRNKFKPLRNRIVKFINDEISKAITNCDGDLIYLNTDGFIIRNAKNKLETSNEIGAFKEEKIDDNTIYFIKNMTSRTKYSLFEYYANGNKKQTIIGGFRKTTKLFEVTTLRDNKYPDIKITRDSLGFENIDIEEK